MVWVILFECFKEGRVISCFYDVDRWSKMRNENLLLNLVMGDYRWFGKSIFGGLGNDEKDWWVRERGKNICG